MGDAPHRGPADLTGHRILVVEDQYLLADDVTRALERCGAEVVGPASGLARSLELARQNTLTAAVLDVDLQGEMVFAVAEELARRQVPFIVTTGYQLPVEHAVLRDAPQLEKPFEMNELIGLIRAMT